MRGVLVHPPDGQAFFVAATAYDVDSAGSLVLRVDAEHVQTIEAGGWVTVESVGRPLVSTWPPDSLGLLIENLGEFIGVRWGDYIWGLGTAEHYSSPLLNDLDALSYEVLRRVDVDPESSDNRRQLDEVRELIRKHFGLSGRSRRGGTER